MPGSGLMLRPQLGLALLYWSNPMTYYEMLKDPRWQKKRLEIMERDEFACRDCGDKESTLNVHHTYYEEEEQEAICNAD